LNISVQAANLSDCRIELKLFLPELECSTGLVAVPVTPSDANHTMTTLAAEENALAQLGQLMSGQVL